MSQRQVIPPGTELESRKGLAVYRTSLRVAGMKPRYVLTLLAFQFASTVFESFGLSMLLPVFQLMESGQEASVLAEDSRFWQILIESYAFLGLEPSILTLLATSFVAILARQAFVYVRLIYFARLRFVLIQRLRERAFQAFVWARLGYIEKQGLGTIVNDLTVEMQVAVECAMAIVRMAGNVVVCLVYVALLMMLSVPITLAALAVMALAAVPVALLLREGRQVGKQLVQANAELLGFLSERLRAIRLIRLSGTGEPEMANMRRRTGRQFDRYMRGFVLQSRTTLLLEPIVAAAAFVFLYLGSSTFDLDLGSMGLFLLVLLRLAPMVKEILSQRFSIANSLGSVEQVERRMAGLRDAAEPVNDAKPFPGFSRQVELRDVVFEYPEQDTAALKGISVSIPAGSITALVGPSGSGKSTLIDLLPRLREPSAGELLYDGVPATAFDLTSLRHAISYAPQAPQIFDVTAAEHIGYGSTEPDLESIQKAAQLAGAHDFICALPRGYDTLLGENGARLSGGQKQRLDLARALLAHSNLLILDEPTSQLDADSEFAFRGALERIRLETDMTIVVVAHRLSTVTIANKIVVLRDGQVEGVGTHAELIAAGGWYAEAFRRQQGEAATGSDIVASISVRA